MIGIAISVQKMRTPITQYKETANEMSRLTLTFHGKIIKRGNKMSHEMIHITAARMPSHAGGSPSQAVGSHLKLYSQV